jgi:hypothetical protein
MAVAPIPTPEVLWRKPPVLALAALPGIALGRLGEPSSASSAAWVAAGAAARMLHDAPLPPWPGRSLEEIASRLDRECDWLVTNGVLPTDLVTRNRCVAEVALRPWTPVFTHGDLQVDHVFVAGDEITGVVDWSEASRGDALYDLATLTLGHEEHLGDVVAGYGAEVDLEVIRAWWSWRSRVAARLRSVLAGLRVRRAEIPGLRLHEPNSWIPQTPLISEAPLFELSDGSKNRRANGVRNPSVWALARSGAHRGRAVRMKEARERGRITSPTR